MIGCVVGPEFDACATIVRIKIEGIANDDTHVLPGIAASSTTVDVGHSPRCPVRRVVRPQLTVARRASRSARFVWPTAIRYRTPITIAAVVADAVPADLTARFLDEIAAAAARIGPGSRSGDDEWHWFHGASTSRVCSLAARADSFLDFLLLALGEFKDGEGRRVRRWS